LYHTGLARALHEITQFIRQTTGQNLGQQPPQHEGESGGGEDRLVLDSHDEEGDGFSGSGSYTTASGEEDDEQ
jgi:hypothetical protein